MTAANGIGRQTAMCDAAGWEAWSYDQMGRVLVERRSTNSVVKTTNYTYNLDGSLASVTYPSGKTIAYAPSGAARPLSAVDSGSGVNFAQTALYAPHGGLTSLTLGQATGFAGITYSESYTTRLQPLTSSAANPSATIFSLTYDFALGTADNGNINTITNNLDANRTQSFTYDQLNRVQKALTTGTTGSTCWGLDYSYDIWANLTTVALDPARPSCSWTILNAGITANNRVNNTGFSYDAAGNVLSDGSFSYTWDGESQMKSAAGVNYTYDGEGRRVQKSSGKLYWYGATGEILTESDAAGNITSEYVFFGSKRIARRDASGNVFYYLSDHQDSSRVIAQSNGTVCYDADFDPFGGEHAFTNTCPQRYKFNGKERDAETGNDDFGARSYASTFGRFLSPDWSAIPAPVPYADLGNPQSLNQYAFVRDNPVAFSDPSGHQPEGQISPYGSIYIAARMRAGGGVNCALELTCSTSVVVGYEVTSTNGDAMYFATEGQALQYIAEAQATLTAQAQNQNNQQAQQNQQNTAPANSRTDVVLRGRDQTPTPQRGTNFIWQMDWYVDTCSSSSCNLSNKYQGTTVTLVESQNGGSWKPTGDPTKGGAHDQISPEAKTFNQHWFVDGKQVQLVVGRDSKGNLIKTWEVHVVINKQGDRPVYSPVP